MPIDPLNEKIEIYSSHLNFRLCCTLDSLAHVLIIHSAAHARVRLAENPIALSIPAGLFRRIAALFYDSIIIFALLMLATAIFLGVTGSTTQYPFNIIFLLYLLVVWFSFIAWFWLHGGQTLGMLAWKIQLKSQNAQSLTLKQAALRFLVALPANLCGLGLIWMFFNKDKLTWQDWVSKTQMYLK